MEESDNETLKETEEQNELRPRSPIRRNQERHVVKQHKSLKITGSPSPTKGIRPPRFREV